MVRPCFLVIDREFPGSISTRKLVVETAKFNVLTAYSAREALDIYKRFPNVDGIVLDGGIDDISPDDFVHKVKDLDSKIPLIVIAVPGYDGCPDADYLIESFAPATLLEVLRSIKPRESDEIERHNEELSREHVE